MPTIVKPPPASNAAVYEKTQKSGNNGLSMIARIHELLTAYKGSTKARGNMARRPTYGTREAAKVLARGN